MKKFEQPEGMSDKEMAQYHTASWAAAIGLSPESILFYIEAVGQSMDQFEEFGVGMLDSDMATELLADKDTIKLFSGVQSCLKFNAVVASTVSSFVSSDVGAKETKENAWNALMELQFSVSWAALVWAYLYGFRKGKQDNTDTDSFDEFISSLDIDLDD